MRLAWVLAPLAGCQLVFPLEGSGVALRDAYPASVPGDQKMMSIPRSDKLVAGDVVIVALRGTADGAALDGSPPNLSMFADATARNCGRQFHAWFFAGVVGTEESFDFHFLSPDPGGVNAVVTAYENASGARSLDQVLAIATSTEPTKTLPALETPAGAAIWLGVATTTLGQSPSNTTPLVTAGNLTAFAAKPGEIVVSAPDDPIDMGECAFASRVVIDP